MAVNEHLKNTEQNVSGKTHPGIRDASGLVSANEMTDTCPPMGWGQVSQMPGVDAAAGAPLNTASGSAVMFDGHREIPFPDPVSFGNPETGGVPMMMLIDVAEPMGPNQGAGLRSAVEKPVDFNK
jgi:hypothetical protein